VNFKRIIQVVTGIAVCAMASSAIAALPYERPITTVKHIESYGTYAIVHLSRDVDNTVGCAGPEDDFPAKLRSFYIDYATPEGRSNYVLVMASATSRKRTGFNVTSCDSGTNLPSVDSVEVSF